MRVSDKEQALINDFPVVFDGKPPWCSSSYGIGWDKLIRELCQEITDILGEPGYCVMAQIKEKFSNLRFYIDPNHENPPPPDKWEKVLEAVRRAEILSSTTCERCGAPGETRSGGWIKVLCDECHVK